MKLPALFSALHGGRKAALRNRLEQSRPGLYRLAFAWCHEPALADDLAQETLIKALDRLHQLRDDTRLRPWLYGILVNVWRDHLRALRPHEDLDSLQEHQLAHQFTPELAAQQAQQTALVRQAVARLPLGQREVLTLVDLEDCSYAEVAGILSLPMGTVMSRLCRARARLRQQLAPNRVPRPLPALRVVK